MEQERKSSIKEKVKIEKPKMYAVILHNDDYTTMDFVVQILESLFNKTREEASILMMEVHHQGKSVAGVYTYDIAYTKKLQAEQLAAEKGFPLRLSIDEAME